MTRSAPAPAAQSPAAGRAATYGDGSGGIQSPNDEEDDMHRDATAPGNGEPTEPTPMDDLPDKPSQAEGDLGDDQLSDDS
jgi:hypothetical protein